jgi:hypothetical protein
VSFITLFNIAIPESGLLAIVFSYAALSFALNASVLALNVSTLALNALRVNSATFDCLASASD